MPSNKTKHIKEIIVMAKFADRMDKIAEGVTEGYQKIEDGVVTGYRKSKTVPWKALVKSSINVSKCCLPGMARVWKMPRGV